MLCVERTRTKKVIQSPLWFSGPLLTLLPEAITKTFIASVLPDNHQRFSKHVLLCKDNHLHTVYLHSLKKLCCCTDICISAYYAKDIPQEFESMYTNFFCHCISFLLCCSCIVVTNLKRRDCRQALYTNSPPKLMSVLY